MKIKTSKEGITIHNLPLVFFVSAVACTALRAVQTAKYIDASTGFYTQTGFFTILFFALLFVTCLAFVVLSYLSRQSAGLRVGAVKSKMMSVLGAVMGVLLLFDSAGSFLSSFASDSSASYGEVSQFKALMATGALPKSLQGFFALFGAIYFFLLATEFKGGRDKCEKHRILALSPVGWVAFRMISLFMSKISFLRVSDLFLELCFLALAAVFFMAFAQVASGVYKEGFEWRLPAFGLSAALLAVSTQLPRLVFTLIDSEKYVNPSHPFRLVDLIFGVFAVALIPALVKGSANAQDDTQAPATEQTDE